jgi:hypothetical protein
VQRLTNEGTISIGWNGVNIVLLPDGVRLETVQMTTKRGVGVGVAVRQIPAKTIVSIPKKKKRAPTYTVSLSCWNSSVKVSV